MSQVSVRDVLASNKRYFGSRREGCISLKIQGTDFARSNVFQAKIDKHMLKSICIVKTNEDVVFFLFESMKHAFS